MDEDLEEILRRTQERERIARRILKTAIQKRSKICNHEDFYIKLNAPLDRTLTDESIITYLSENSSEESPRKEEQILFGTAYCIETPYTREESPEKFEPLITENGTTDSLPTYTFYFEKGKQFASSIKNMSSLSFRIETEGAIDQKMAKLLKRLFKSQTS